MNTLLNWWNSRTKHVHGKVVLTASETSFLWGVLKFTRYRAYLVSHIDAVKPETPHRTWRSVTVGPLSLLFRFPKFVEDRCD